MSGKFQCFRSCVTGALVLLALGPVIASTLSCRLSERAVVSAVTDVHGRRRNKVKWNAATLQNEKNVFPLFRLSHCHFQSEGASSGSTHQDDTCFKSLFFCVFTQMFSSSFSSPSNPSTHHNKFVSSSVSPPYISCCRAVCVCVCVMAYEPLKAVYSEIPRYQSSYLGCLCVCVSRRPFTGQPSRAAWRPLTWCFSLEPTSTSDRWVCARRFPILSFVHLLYQPHPQTPRWRQWSCSPTI